MPKYEMDDLNKYPEQADYLREYEWMLFYCLNDTFAKELVQEIVTIFDPVYDVDETERGVWVSSENETIIGIDSFDNVVILFSYNRESINFIQEAYWDDERIENIAYVQTELDIKNQDKLRIEFTTGFLEKEHSFINFEDILPTTISKLFLDGVEIGKAVLSYINSEMSEVNPTVDYIEVISTQQRKGYGSFFLKQIEKYLERSSFDLIWISDVQEYDFFRKNGYEFDIDEGYKYLEY